MNSRLNDPLPFARGFWELVVYQRARNLQRRVFEVSKTFPREEAYSLTDQIRRAARSIGAQIAEAWGKRAYQKHFVSKLSDAISECNETQHWIMSAVDDGYIAKEAGRELWNLCLEVGRMLSTISDRADEFCQNSVSTRVREDSEDIFTRVPPPCDEPLTNY